jgi:Ca2+-binding EF-hand superfamily protein
MDMIGESVTDLQLNEMLAIADIDHDGKINYEGKYSEVLVQVSKII